MHKQGLGLDNHSEFLAYRILYQVGTEQWAGLTVALTVLHSALCWAVCNYVALGPDFPE